jgi:hypothetical protein
MYSAYSKALTAQLHFRFTSMFYLISSYLISSISFAHLQYTQLPTATTSYTQLGTRPLVSLPWRESLSSTSFPSNNAVPKLLKSTGADADTNKKAHRTRTTSTHHSRHLPYLRSLNGSSPPSLLLANLRRNAAGRLGPKYCVFGRHGRTPVRQHDPKPASRYPREDSNLA